MRVSGGPETLRRIAVYGEVDPNLVDGSSVWLISVCQVLASIGGVEVTLLLRRPLEPGRRYLLAELEANERIDVVDAGREGLLAPAEALDRLEELDRERGPFDLVLLRGQSLLTEAAARDAFDGRLWPYVMTGRGMGEETLRALAARSHRLLVQTEAATEELHSAVPEASDSVLILPPMIPDTGPPPSRNGEPGPLRLVYSGKLAPEYCWLETVEAFRALREAEPGAELHVIGDKIHRPPDQPEFHDQALRALRETEGLRWHGAVPRSAVNGLLAGCDLALSIRDPSVEAAHELSTKVLEYGAAGLPVVLNRAPAYERLLGADYPLFLDDPEEATGRLTGPALSADARAAAAAASHAASREFTFTQVAEFLVEHLPEAVFAAANPQGVPGSADRSASDHAVSGSTAPLRPGATVSPQTAATNGSSSRDGTAPRVLIAGHDLKFTGPIREAIASAGGTVIEDVWKSHTEHDEATSRAALDQADVILCEWCLGNAAWYSRNKRPDQRLVIRLYRVEVYSDYPAAVDMDNVDQVAFDSQHILDEAIERFGWDPAKLTVIPNGVDADRLCLPKHKTARQTLAMVGYVPKRKRLDRALDILELLRREDPRFRLILIGHPPSGLGWVARDADEVEFFRDCYARIQNTDELRGAVTFKPFTEDIPAFFQHAGFILSTSDSEGHQITLAEAAASGAIPVILDRPGASDKYPNRWVHLAAGEAAAAIAVSTEDWEAEGVAAVEHAAGWSRQELCRRWLETLVDWRTSGQAIWIA